MKMQTDYVLKEKQNTALQFFISADHACHHRHPGHQMLERFKKDLLGLSEDVSVDLKARIRNNPLRKKYKKGAVRVRVRG